MSDSRPTKTLTILAQTLALLAGPFIAYAPGITGGFIWDDDIYITENPLMHSVEGLQTIWLEPAASRHQYYPLVSTSFWLEFQIWGTQPTPYRVTNLVLHGLCALLVWRLGHRLKLPGAWLIAAIFALHPMHVESVAWIAERKNTLSGLFFLASLLAYLRFQPVEDNHAATPPKRYGWYALAALTFVAALLSKTVTLTMPAVVLLLLWWRRRLRLAAVWPLLPFFALGIALAVVTVITEAGNVSADAYEFTWLERLLIAGRAWCFYPQKLLWPAELLPIYPQWSIDTHQWWQYLYPAAALAVVITLWLLRGPLGRGPLVAVLYYGGTILPAVGFVQVGFFTYSFVADHFFYLPSLGLIALFVATGIKALRRLGSAATSAQPALAVILLLALGLRTWQQAALYRHTLTLWQATIKANPQCWLGYYQIGTRLVRHGHQADAVPYFEQAIKIHPDYFDAINNLGNVYLQLGRHEDALRMFRRALRISPADAPLHFNVGVLYVEMGDLRTALIHFTRATNIDPSLEAAQQAREQVEQRLGIRPQPPTTD